MLNALLTALSAPLMATGSACAAPAITSVVANEVGHTDDLNTYDIAITIKNDGAAEPSSLLQSVQIFQDATRVDQKGTPPLAAGASATVHYRMQRSSEARPGSTHLRFSIVMRDPHIPVADCSGSNATYRIDV